MFVHKVMTPFFGNAINLNRFYCRSLITGTSYSQRVLEETCETKHEEQWVNAKDYEAIPGPTKYEIFRYFLPGGQLHKANIIKMNKVLRERYGDIYRLKGFGVKPDTVFTNNPIDFEQTYRNEGIRQIRAGLQTLTYYRKKKQPDVFNGIGGFVSDRFRDDFILLHNKSTRSIIHHIRKYIESPGFKRLLQTYDGVTENTNNYIKEAIKSFEVQGNREAKNILEQLYRIDKRVAITLAMLMAGIDTTSYTLISLLYLIAKNCNKQQAVRNELRTIMAHKDTPITGQNTKNMPYVRACIKEALRITPITPSNYRITTMNLVLSGYKIPAGTGMLNVMALSNAEKDFPRIDEFLPKLRILFFICVLVWDYAPALANKLLKWIERFYF